MSWPFSDDYQEGDPLHKIRAEDYGTVLRILNYIQGVGCTIEKEPTGYGWKIVVNEAIFNTDTQGGGTGTDLNQQFVCTSAATAGKASFKPGMWVRDANWNGTRRAASYEYDVLANAGVASSYTGNIYAYALLQYGTGYNANGWNPSSIDLDNDAEAAQGAYTTWVPNALDQGFAAQGIEMVFSDARLVSARAHDGDGYDPQHQLKLIAEITYDTGAITEITQAHTGPILDTDPLWRGQNASVGADGQFRPYLKYESSTSITLAYTGGKWYSPRGSISVTVGGDSWTDAAIDEEKLYLTAMPLEANKGTTSPDPSLVPSNVRFEWNDGTSYNASSWTAAGATGQALVAEVFTNTTFGTAAIPVLDAGFYSVDVANGVFSTRPDGEAASLAAVDTGTPIGRSIGYVPSATSTEHEGETEQWKFSDTTYVEAPSGFSQFGDSYAIEVREVASGVSTQRYVNISGLKFPGDSTSGPDSGWGPGDMDTTDTGWVDWIDDWEHDHGAHSGLDDDDHLQYIILDSINGTALRNAMGGVIGDAGGDVSIAPNTRDLVDSDGQQSADWGGRDLKDASGTTSISWNARQAFDTTGNISVDWATRQLEHAAGMPTASWDTLGFSLPDTSVDYYHNTNRGASVADWTSGGIVYGGDVTAYTIRTIPAGGGQPIEIEVLGRPI